ncbi:MAG TPA: DEAD/DEAH box helicase family protein [bacterium]|nr:DEAD/DEAH box helicase family protein [bacterium]
MLFDEILTKYRKIAFSERDKGARFERLMRLYLMTDKLYANYFTNVWLWSDFPFRKDFGGKDTGIDMVAKDKVGDYTAIQCKCYAEDATIDKAAVDSFLATSGKSFRDESLKSVRFAHRLWISTTNNWNKEAENTIRNQHPPVFRISLTDLRQAPVKWEKLEEGLSGKQSLLPKKVLRDHQKTALENAHEHFKAENRGKMIMACGTGKTFTALKIAEHETKGKGTILFLVPSISLLGQTLREWSAEADDPLNAICICSDTGVSQKKTRNEDFGGFTIEDIALPASTDVKSIVSQFENIENTSKKGMTVFFSTYHSIDVVAKAQKALNKSKKTRCIFDLVICDEAHRTTGVTLAGEDESHFVKVHDDDVIQAKKRIYMTATPKLYSDDSKSKAKEADAVLCSMDDPAMFGEEFYRIGFGESVERDLLSDYKVLVLTLRDDQIPASLQKAIAKGSTEINTDDASKLIGCINALSKRMLLDADLLKTTDPEPMRRAVAFCQSIKISKQITTIFNTYKDAYYESLAPEDRKTVVNIDASHVDGTMPSSIRDQKLEWLKSSPPSGNECRILNNVRCLSEGVDVPSLDAVLFLSARNSQVDVVQSVGRVMRRAPNKKYGYIIIPVVVPSNITPEEALSDNKRFAVVWTVLNALRAHDDRFNATVNKIELNKRKPDQILVGGIPDPTKKSGDDATAPGDGTKFDKKISEQLALQFGELQSVIYARMVQKVGSKRYWEQWAKDVALIAENNISRINNLIKKKGPHKEAFEEFLGGLRKNINPSIEQQDAVEMLSQHIITKPVFEALFENYSFAKSNAVSVSMQRMLDLLEEQSMEKDMETLDRFYKSVRQRAEGIDNAEGRQRIIIELYDKFFKTAFPLTVEKLGIVYTPVEVVDFIIHSVSDVLKAEFGRSLSDENVHILDPFTGTGTFITRLLQSGLITQKALKRKYEKELHANEIVLLAYYIASINIENVYHDLISNGNKYQPFEGICLTDTFQLGEYKDNGHLFSKMFPQNSDRVIAQKKAPIRVIVSNPPYSVGQKEANDNAQNLKYEKLDRRIAETYAKESTATLQNSLYDSYIKSFRWASDRLDSDHGGIIAFVSNGSWLDGNATDGFRKSLEREFTSIYVFNLRGNCRTQGDLRRREAGNIFGLGSRTPISITLLVRNPASKGKNANIRYRDIGDYLNREEKLKIICEFGTILNSDLALKKIKPNKHGDWINIRDEAFGTFIPLGDKKKKKSKTVFEPYYSCGVKTNRDSWCYNFSKSVVDENIRQSVDFYNNQVKKYIEARNKKKSLKVLDFVDRDPKKFSWDRAQRNDAEKGKTYSFSTSANRPGIYRPFVKQWMYFHRDFNNCVYQQPKLFPTKKQDNIVICVSGVGVTKAFSTIITDTLPDLELIGKSQCFPLYYYEEAEKEQASLFDKSISQYNRRDGVTDFIHKQARIIYGPKVTKEDIFYYVYGLLHSPEYRTRYSADLKKMLPRIPLVDEPKMFWAFSKAGRELAEWHLNYETVDPFPATVKKSSDNFIVNKIRFAKKGKKVDKSTIIYNSSITVSEIPMEAHEYVVNGKSAIEWIMERYAVTTHKASGITNDPNDWAKEHKQPRYILDLLLRVIRVSVETVKIVEQLPSLPDFS